MNLRKENKNRKCQWEDLTTEALPTGLTFPSKRGWCCPGAASSLRGREIPTGGGLPWRGWGPHGADPTARVSEAQQLGGGD